jgi:NTP pyrophosphatase (non-canonical NTP hydrolase)
MNNEQEPQTLNELQTHFVDLYGRRNNIWLSGRFSRINLLNVALADLQDVIRKDGKKEDLDTMFARIPSRIFCLAHGINNVSVAWAMAEKYPLNECAYCHNFPCNCSEKRSEVVLATDLVPQQLIWRLKDWQKHLGLLYGDKNKERGIDNVMLRLFKEVAELMNLEHYEVPRFGVGADEIEHEYGLELADCMAWTIAAANILETDLERVTLDRFWPVCWNCHQKPCVCSNFSFRQVRI